MPDLFIAPDEKPVRSRIPANNTVVPSSPQQPEVTQSLQNSQPNETPSSTPPSIQSITPPSSQPPREPPYDSSETTNPLQEKSLIADDETERRNGILPLFSSFWENPKSVYFDTQEPDEHILLFLRRHFITNSPWIFFTIVLLILPPLTFILLNTINYSIGFLPTRLMQIVFILYYLLVLTNAFVNFIDWYYNISIITTKHVLDIYLQDLVSKKVSATEVSKVQDVDFKQTGTIPTIFNYGDVIIQTAGTELNFVADAVPNPELVVQIVESLIGKKKESNDIQE